MHTGVKTIFAGSSCNDLVTLHGNHIVSGHFDKRVRFWDTRSDSSTNEIMLQGRLTSLNLAPGNEGHDGRVISHLSDLPQVMKVMLQGCLTSFNLAPWNEGHVTGLSHISQSCPRE